MMSSIAAANAVVQAGKVRRLAVTSGRRFPGTELAITPVLPMHFRKGDTSLQLFTTIATLGTPQDITLQELRVECFFPMDDDTTRTLRAWTSKTI